MLRRADDVGWDAWVHEAALPPRRGRKPAGREESSVPLLEDARARPDDAPPPALPEPLEAPAPALAAAAPTLEGATPAATVAVADAVTSRRAGGPSPGGGWTWGVVLGVLLAMVALAWNLRRVPHGPEAPRVPRAVQEVALSHLPPDAGPAALPPLAEAPPAAVAPRAAPSKDGALVKKPLSPSRPITPSVKQAVGAAGLCLTLACASSPQVRPPPAPEDCPAKSLKAMEALDIDLDDELSARFVGGGGAGTYLDVRQGNWKVQLVDGASDKFRGRTELSCYLTLSDRVYGRCPSARTRDGTTHPVCFELLNTNGDLGTPREDDSTGDTSRVHSTLRVRAVSRYE